LIPYRYDGGNALLSSNFGAPTSCGYWNSLSGGYIPWTSGSERDGSRYYGAGSTYRTIAAPGIFVLKVRNANVTFVGTKGNLGADGYGSVQSSSFNLTASGIDVRVFIKSTSDGGRGDPAVLHLWIVVPSCSSDVPRHNPHPYCSQSTNSDGDVVEYPGTNFEYLLLAKAPRTGFPSTRELTSLVAAYLTSSS